MCGKKEEDDQGECSQSIHQSIQNYQEQLFLHHQLQQQQQQQQQYGGGGGGGSGRGGGGLLFPEISPILPWSFSPVHNFNPVQFSSANTIGEQQQQHQHHHDPFLVPPPPPAPPPPPPPLPPTSSSSYGGFFNRRAASALQFAYEHHHHHNPSSSADHHHHLRIISDQVLLGSTHVHHQPGSSSHPFGSLQAELGKMTAQEIMDAKALAASKSHSEAERRRRERINNHLAKLRSLLPSTTKTDKASLLAEVIQHVKELKRQTSQIAEASPVPTENDELTVDNASDEDGNFIIKASLCCEDRTDLLPDLIKTLKALRLRTLKAEITTLGGRVKNVLFITEDHEQESSSSSKINEQHQHSLNSIQEALKAVMERTTTSTPPSGDHDQHQMTTTTTTTSSGSIKRQRTNNNMNMLEQQQQQHRSL